MEGNPGPEPGAAPTIGGMDELVPPEQARRGRRGDETAVAHWVEPPDDIDASGIEKASGVVELPRTVWWSGTLPRFWDLDDLRERARVYEVVLREGSQDDIRRYVELDQLVELWGDLFLPDRLRRTWAAFLRDRKGVDLEV